MNLFRALDDYVVPRLGRGLALVLGTVMGSEHGGHPRRRLLLGAAGLSVALAGAATVLTGAQGRVPGAPPRPPGVVRVGAAEGVAVDAYLASSRAELSALAARSTAEVSALAALDSYVEPSALPGMLRGITAEAAFARVPLPDLQTEIVDLPLGGVAAAVTPGFAQSASRKEAAAKEATWAAGKLTGKGQRERQLRAFYQDVAKVNSAEAEAFRRECACVYAVVVRGTPVRLRQLAARPGVRVVDPAPEITSLGTTQFLPLQPEQIAVVTPPTGRVPAAPPG
jgi:hypothetical protein